MKILLTGGKSAVALKLLKAFSKDSVVLADYGEVPSFVSKEYQFITLGIKDEEVLAHTLLTNCLNEGVEALLPIHGFEIEALAKAEILFKEFNISLLLPDVFELSEYFKPEKNNKKENWGIFIDGNIVFSTKDDEEVRSQAKNKKLNGVFYIHSNNEFILLTI